MKIEKKWKKYHKLLIIPLMVIIMFVSITIGVNANSTGSPGEEPEYVIISPTNPDLIIFAIDDLSYGYYLGGEDIMYYSQSYPNPDLLDGWVVFNPVSENTDMIYRVYNIDTTLQIGRYRVFTEIRNREEAATWEFHSITWEKNDFYLLKRDVGASVTTVYGLFPQIRLYELNQPIQLICDIEATYYYLDNNQLQERQILTQIVTSTNQDFALHFNNSILNAGTMSDNTILYFSYWRMVITPYNQNAGWDRMSYSYTLIGDRTTATDDSYYTIAQTFLNDIANNTNTGGNGGTILDVGASMLASVNSFFQFELLPGFSLFNILTICLAIPLLIWILKLIMGG